VLTVPAGVGLGTLNTALFELLDQVTPAGSAVEALTWLTTLQALGLAVGAAGAGQLASHGAALTFVALPPLIGAGLVSARRATLRTTPALQTPVGGGGD
jgi:hypothetical protein